MARNQCILYPEAPNGEPSKLYKDLLKMTNNRQLTNYIYATYCTLSAIGTQMDSAGKTRDKNGEHSAKDVYYTLDVAKLENVGGDVDNIAKRIGAKDYRGNTVDFTDAHQAIQIAQNLNANNDKVVAYVEQVGDVFNILVRPINSKTQIKALRMEEQQKSWDLVQQTFSKYGIDIDSLDFVRDLVNPLQIKSYVQWLRNNQATRNNIMTLQDIKMYLTMNENIPSMKSQIDRLKTMFGSIDEISQKIYDAYRARRGQSTVTASQFALMDATITDCKKLGGLDIKALLDNINDLQDNLRDNSDAQAIENTLDNLRKKYRVDSAELHQSGNEIKSLSDAAVEASYTLKRELDQLMSKVGPTAEGKKIEASLNRLTREIANNRYYTGLLGFLSEALTQINNIDNMLFNTPTNGTNLENAKNMAITLQKIKEIRDGYYHIVDALSTMDKLFVDQPLSPTDRKTIQDQAKQVKDFFDRNDQVIKDKGKETMKLILREYLGDSLANGTSINRLVEQFASDSSMYDQFYSVGRVSNHIIATMGQIIREAQDQRTVKLTEISRKIRRATNELYKAGFNSEFMYDENGYIISDIDWEAFNKARRRAIASFKKKGYKGQNLDEQIKAWEDAHMEDRIVDPNNGRTERVPNSSYRLAENPVDNLDPIQQKYYHTMMAIRGEIGTLLPYYAQRHHYIAPQLRRSFVDAMNEAIRARSLRKAGKAIKNKLQDIYKIREDDTDFVQNAVVEGEDYVLSAGALDNTPLRRIPLFYLNRIKDKGELLKDFSGSLQALAGTAINYDCVNNIKDMVEFMGDFIRGQVPAAQNDDKNIAETIVTNSITMYKNLRGHASNSHTLDIVDSFIDQHIYGVKIKNQGKWTKLLKTMLAYTSIRALAVNVKGALSNYLVGEIQMLIEAGAGEFYNLKDYAWANMVVFGDNSVRAYGRIMDFMTNNKNSKAALLAERFDPLNEEFGELSHQRYYRSKGRIKGPLRHLLGKDFTFIGYGAGEHMIHYVTMYAILHNTKVRIDGVEGKTLYDAFSVSNKSDGNSELVLNGNVEYKDDNGNWVKVDDAFLNKIRGRIRYCNQNTHGSMNEEDKGIIHQRMLGRFVMNLRQWMVEHYSRRYRGSHWDASLGEEREGFYYTTYQFAKALWKDHQNFNFQIRQHWNEMTTQQKANFRRATAELSILGLLHLLAFGLGEPDEHKKDFWMRMWIYQVKRAIVDVNGSQPLGIPVEMNTLLNSPIAATNTLKSFLYPFVGIGDINKTVQRGDYKGWNKYARNILKYEVPFYHQIDQLMKMDEDDSLFAVFENDMN